MLGFIYRFGTEERGRDRDMIIYIVELRQGKMYFIDDVTGVESVLCAQSRLLKT